MDPPVQDLVQLRCWANSRFRLASKVFPDIESVGRIEKKKPKKQNHKKSRNRRPWYPRSQSGRVERRDKSFQSWAEEPLGTDSHRTISKRSRECWLLIGHKKCFVLLCPISEQHLLSSFREFVYDGYWLDHSLSGPCTKEMHAVRNLSAWYKRYISKYW